VRLLLTDPDERSSLAVARSALAAGHEVLVPRTDLASLTGVARRVRFVAPLPDPLTDPVGFAYRVGSQSVLHAIDVVLPVTDPSVEALLTHRGELPETLTLPFPGGPEWFAGTDKARGLAMAERAGLAAPESVVIASREALTLPGTDFFPAVAKPHRSVAPASNGTKPRKLTAVRVADRYAAASLLASWPASAFPVLLQREIEGPGEGLFLLRWDGRIVAAFAHRRLREKPPWGGVSVYRESIPVPPALLSAGTALLDELDWRGVAMIECKRELSSGRHVFMELNGRFWGSLQLALDAGLDFPRLLLDQIQGHAPTELPSYRVGVRSRWLWGDVDHLYLRLRHGPARLQAVGAFLAHRPGRDREEIWRWRDPAPFILETLRRFGIRR
jgi:predicted ATP-grasp superfamily ATP-dependent carboligase